MYAKVFARITESSLMEEEIPVRYTFVMLLAISDPTGLVVGTNVALARRLNMPLNLFEACIDSLSKEDRDSNSKEEGGRRLIPSDGERGYQIVNYLKYRNIKDAEEKRRYMREYMRERRANESGKSCKPRLTNVTQAEAEADAEAGGRKKPPLNSANEDKILWEAIWWFPSKLHKQLELLEKEIVGKEGDERKTLNAKKNSLLIALGVKLPKSSKPKVVACKPERSPPTPEEGKKLADALRQAVAEA